MKIPILFLFVALSSGCAVHNHYYPASTHDAAAVGDPDENEGSQVQVREDELVLDQPEPVQAVASAPEFEPEGGFDDRPAASDIIPSKPHENRSSVFAGCDVKNHGTGWSLLTVPT